MVEAPLSSMITVEDFMALLYCSESRGVWGRLEGALGCLVIWNWTRWEGDGEPGAGGREY